MISRITAAGVVLLSAAILSCRDGGQSTGVGSNARVEVSSDPQGASILLNSKDTGKKTPDLLRDLDPSQKYEILVRLPSSNNVVYGYRVTGLQVQADALIHVHGPLTMRCSTSIDCAQFFSTYTAAGMRFSLAPNGALFYAGTNNGLFFPSNARTANGYVSIAQPLVAMLSGTRDTLSLGIYDTPYLAGRPTQDVSQTSERFSLRQSFWTVPTAAVLSKLAPTVRGIEVNEELLAVSAQSDVAFIKLTFSNITNNPSYQAVDPLVPSEGITYSSVYMGMGVDPDIGVAEDDAVTYDPTQNMVYAYDIDFAEDMFGDQASRPSLVGLKLVEAPTGTVVALNAWPKQSDWSASGDPTRYYAEKFGWGVLSGLKPLPGLVDVAGQLIGHVLSGPGDYRMSVSAGPVTLAPGASASITVAILLAAPVPGTYSAGTAVDAGNPWDPNRPIANIAAALLQKASTLTVPQ